MKLNIPISTFYFFSKHILYHTLRTCQTNIKLLGLILYKRSRAKTYKSGVCMCLMCGRGVGLSTQFVKFTICFRFINDKKEISIFHSFYFEKEVVNKHPLVLWTSLCFNFQWPFCVSSTPCFFHTFFSTPCILQ